MFIYQSLIMLAVIVIVCVFAYVIKIKNRTLLASIILVSILAAGLGMYAVQNYFGIHFYTQQVDTASLQKIRISTARAADVRRLFSTYSAVSPTESDSSTSGSQKVQANTILRRTYHLYTGGASSTVQATVYTFGSEEDADSYFEVSQRFYENKTYLPGDPKQSQKEPGKNPRYIVSYVKSNYDDVNDLMYFPSKISYLSSVTVQTGRVIIALDEESSGLTVSKNSVIRDILAGIS